MIENSVFNELPEEIKCNLEKLNITEPSKVQERIIPMILERKSVVFQSETGTGKTFAYLLPILKNIETFRKDNPQDVSVKALVCAPTFELASQINQAAKSVSSTKTALFIGGAPVKRQIETLKEKPEIVIGTPARLVELIRLKKLKVSKLQFVVFDEADRLIKKSSQKNARRSRQSFRKIQFQSHALRQSQRKPRIFSVPQALKFCRRKMSLKGIYHTGHYMQKTGTKLKF